MTQTLFYIATLTGVATLIGVGSLIQNGSGASLSGLAAVVMLLVVGILI